MRTEKACGAIISRQNPEGITEILLVKQKNGFISFPKGHVERNETESETAKREVLEETGLKVKLLPTPRIELSYDMAVGSMYQNPPVPNRPIHKTVILFLATPESGEELAQPSEISKLLWVKIDEVESYLAYPAWRRAWAEALPHLTETA